MEREEIILNRPIREQIASIIRREIISGQLQPGQQIVEREISNSMNVSTTPVKEAFRMLEAEGLLSSIPRKGTVVTEFTKQNMEQINLLLSSLEGVAARIAVSSLDDACIAKLSGLLACAKDYLNDGNLEDAVKINTEFHKRIRLASNNPFLIQTIETLHSYEQYFRYKALKNLEERHKGYEEHLAILEAIKKKDFELVETLIRNHVRRSAMNMMQNDESVSKNSSK